MIFCVVRHYFILVIILIGIFCETDSLAEPTALVITHANAYWDRNQIAKQPIDELIGFFTKKSDTKIFNLIPKRTVFGGVSQDNYVDFERLPETTRFVPSFQGEIEGSIQFRQFFMTGGYFDQGCLQNTFAHLIGLSDWNSTEPLIFHFVVDAIYAGQQRHPYPTSLRDFARFESLSDQALVEFTKKNLELDNPFKSMARLSMKPDEWMEDPWLWFRRRWGFLDDLHPSKKQLIYVIQKDGVEVGTVGRGSLRIVINYLTKRDLNSQLLKVGGSTCRGLFL